MRRCCGFNGAAVLGPRRAVSRRRRAARSAASMGPRSWDRGENATDTRGAARREASMGPRSWDRGEHGMGRLWRAARAGFNGAAVLGPRRAAGESAPYLACVGFNGAAVLGPRRDGG